MSILVVCKGCKKSFKVSDKFAGKSGACPQCKAVIHVPLKQDEVKVHGPAVTAAEKSVKPILREETKVLQPVTLVIVGGATLVVLIITWVAGGLIRDNPLVLTVGLLLISPPLVVAPYTFLRNDELEPYRGLTLWTRACICSLAYVILWGVFGYASGRVLSGELWEWMFIIPPFLAAGAIFPLACLDLDYGSGFFHYAFYVIVTILLRWIAGMGWVWEVANK